MAAHTIKHTHEDGNKLESPIYWCGKKSNPYQWCFLDTHHLALSVGGSVAPCKNCVKAIIKTLNIEVNAQ